MCLFNTWIHYICHFFQGILLECNGLQAEYQFQKDKHYDVSYDVGKFRGDLAYVTHDGGMIGT